ncbi:MAG: pyruvate kinase, partial [Dehalococcoidia bacterium]|nr:pyruvate kinase [Dehalococcoidia bacterium]
MRRTKIVATLGPATDDEGVLRRLIEAGTDVVRVNFSHGERDAHAKRITSVRRLAEQMGRVVAVMQDLQGPKLRVGALRGGAVELREGARVVITTEQVRGTSRRISTSYRDLPRNVRRGDAVLLDDGLLELRVEGASGNEVECTVVRGGSLRERKGINLPGVQISSPALTAKDDDDLRFGLAQGVDMVALSFVRRPEDAKPARRIMAEAGVNVPLLAKIEKPEALKHLDRILRAFDGVMVARGDLGVELSAEQVPAAQKRIIARANALGKPVITATQMLDSMTHSRTPTRAEASDVANAVLDGSDAVMLSGETAIGEFPVDAVRMMDRIVREAERLPGPPPQIEGRVRSRAHAVCYAAVALAEEVGADALAALTRSGRTARILSKLRPGIPIFSLCEREAVARQLARWRGVAPVMVDQQA